MDELRTQALLPLTAINNKRVLFAGLGSLGAATLTLMAYPFKEFILADGDFMNRHNLDRHPLGLSDLDNSKVNGMRNWLINKGISATSISTHVGKAEDVLESLDQPPDLVIVSVDSNTAKRAINEVCVQRNIPALYGSVFQHGVGGRTFIVTNPSEVCMHCCMLTTGMVAYNPSHDYGVSPASLTNENNEPIAVPALNHSVYRMATQLANAAVHLLKGGEISPRYIMNFFTWNSFETAMTLSEANAEKLIPFVMAQPSMGLIPTIQFQSAQSSVNILSSSGEFHFVAKKHPNCPLHSGNFSGDI